MAIDFLPCLVCGNEIPCVKTLCPFCGSEQDADCHPRFAKAFQRKVVNLELGRPIVATALARLQREIDQARKAGVRVVTIIHGYGSSGKGGVIREECRRALEYMRTTGQVDTFVTGEEFHRKLGPTRALLRRYPQLKDDANINRNNPGITLVII